MSTTRLRSRLGLAAGMAADGLEQAIELRRPRPRGLAYAQRRTRTRDVERALALGAEFLRARQRPNGVWKGFLLAPGAATSWLTAHVAFVVENVPELMPSCRRAAAHLASVGADDGGWGYNRRVSVDCDSTAQALMVLGRFGANRDPFLVQDLAARQLPSGGFPTYDPERAAVRTGWHDAHPDVTALVAEALRREGGFTPVVERSDRWLAGQLEDGALPSYWWPGVHYGLWVQARTRVLAPASATAAREALSEPRTTPQLGMALTAAATLELGGREVDAALADLIGTQLADGSWPCAPCLRLTDPTYRGAPSDAPGRVVADRTRVFSTAHALAALHAGARRGDEPAE